MSLVLLNQGPDTSLFDSAVVLGSRIKRTLELRLSLPRRLPRVFLWVTVLKENSVATIDMCGEPIITIIVGSGSEQFTMMP